jgi:cation transport ATPase
VPRPPTTAASHQLKIPLIGLDCRACARRLETRLRGNPAVAAARFDRAERTLHLTLRGEADATAFVEAVSLSGYDPALSRVRLPLPGLHFGAAAASVEAAVAGLDGMRRAVADPASRALEADYVPGRTTIDEIRAAAARSGVAADHAESAAATEVRRATDLRRARLAAAAGLAGAVSATILALPALIPELRLTAALTPVAMEAILAAILLLIIFAPARRWIAASVRLWLRRIPDAAGLHGFASLMAAATAFGSSVAALSRGAENTLAAELYPTAVWVIAFGLLNRFLLMRIPPVAGAELTRPADADGVSRILAAASAAAAVAAFAAWFVLRPEDRLITAAVASASVLAVSSAGVVAAAASANAAGLVRRLQGSGVKLQSAGAAAEMSRRLTVVLDYEATLTEQDARLTDYVLLNGTGPEDLLQLSGTLAAASDNPILQRLGTRERRNTVVSDLQESPGGVAGRVDGVPALLGRPEWIAGKGVDLSELQEELGRFSGEAKSVRVLAVDGVLRGALAFADELSPAAAGAVERLQRDGFEIEIVSSGDATALATRASQLGVGKASGELTAAGKRRELSRLRREGKRVAVITRGTGAEALGASADLLVTLGEGGTGDMTVEGDLSALSEAFNGVAARAAADRSARKAAIAWHTLALPLAALAPLTVWPAIAAAASLAASSWILWRACRTLEGNRS